MQAVTQTLYWSVVVKQSYGWIMLQQEIYVMTYDVTGNPFEPYAMTFQVTWGAPPEKQSYASSQRLKGVESYGIEA